jgi:hypothetical protein
MMTANQDKSESSALVDVSGQFSSLSDVIPHPKVFSPDVIVIKLFFFSRG